jgi:hypothetical protein
MGHDRICRADIRRLRRGLRAQIGHDRVRQPPRSAPQHARDE